MTECGASGENGLLSMFVLMLFFFFQAEDGIRDHCVTGVQTCALPIYLLTFSRARRCRSAATAAPPGWMWRRPPARAGATPIRSEESRVGKECTSRGGGNI